MMREKNGRQKIGGPDTEEIKLLGEVDEQEVIEYCKQNLASYKKPRSVIFVDKLPRNPAGKVLKTTLRDQFPKTTVKK